MYLYGSHDCFLGCKWQNKSKYVMLLSYYCRKNKKNKYPLFTLGK